MLNVRFSIVRVIAFVSTAVKTPWNDTATDGAAARFLTGGAGVLVVACALDDAGTARMAAAHKVSIEIFAMCFFITVEVKDLVYGRNRGGCKPVSANFTMRPPSAIP
jgi:hypothetical protein